MSAQPNILVTGLNGFIGRQVLPGLRAQGLAIHAISRSPPEEGQYPDVIWHQAELLNDEGWKVVDQVKPAILLHLAWETEHGAFWSAPSNSIWMEVSKDLFKAFTQAGGQRLVAAGTCAEYDWARVGDLPIREESHLGNPHTPYGQAKYNLFSWLQAGGRHHPTDFAWGRLFLLHGEGEAAGRLVPSVAQRLLIGHPAPMSKGTQRRDFIDSRDAGGAFAALVKSDFVGPVNIGSGDSATIADVAKIIAELIGRPDLLEIGALPMRPDDPPSLIPDLGRLFGKIRFMPQYRLKEGLAHTIETIKKQGRLLR